MNEEYLKSIIEIVAGIETSSETQSIAKYELIEYVEQLKDRIGKAINWTIKYQTEWCQEDEVIRDLKQLLEILKCDNND